MINMESLFIKTNYSLLSSLIDIDKLMNYAQDHQVTALGIIDENMYGVMEFYKKCRANHIKPIIGLDVDGVILFAKEFSGYQSLIRLATIKSERKVTNEDLLRNRNQVLVVLPFDQKHRLEELTPIYSEIYLGYEDLEQRKQVEKYPNKKVFYNEVLYFQKEDRVYLNFAYAIRDLKKISDPDRLSVQGHNHHIMTKDELKLCSNMEDYQNIEEIVSLCHVEINSKKRRLPIYDPKIDPDVYLEQLCRQGLKRLGLETKEYFDRLEYELDIIKKMQFSNYFLVVYDFIKYAKEHGILVGPGRGSAPGSLVVYALNITTIDPLKYNLLFERFLNPERITMPDIDTDFPSERREEVIDYVVKKYGDKRVAGIITFGTLGAKQVVRDVGRVLDIPTNVVDVIARAVNANQTLIENYNQKPFIRDYVMKGDNLKKLYKIASTLEGMPRHSSIHAAGIIMSSNDLDDIIPLDHSHKDFYVTGYSMDHLEELGLLKMDFLGIKNLSLIVHVLEDIKDPKVTFDSIPMNDPETLKLFQVANTEGIFQFESDGMKNFLRKLKPNSFEDIVLAIALFRPGPMDNIDTCIRRKEGKEKITYPHPSLEPILNDTYGIIIYQEQIMLIANKMAGYSLGEADVLRRAMSKKKADILMNEKEKFVTRSIERGYEKPVALAVYELILKFANYGFNRSHSVAYALVGYRMAYLKTHYPKVFMKNLFNMVQGSEVKTKDYIYESRVLDIEILKPDINQSTNQWQVEPQGIRMSLGAIKNIGGMACNEILKERQNGPFTDFFDFVARTYGKAVNQKTIESLIDAGVFESFGLNHRTFHHNIDRAMNYAELKKEIGNSLLEIEKPIIDEVEEFDMAEKMERELALFGFYLSKHPVTKYKTMYHGTPLNELQNYFDKRVNVVVYADKIREIITKKGERMLFVVGRDELDSVDLILFPKIAAKYPDLKVKDILYVYGRIEKRFDKLQMVVETVKIC